VWLTEHRDEIKAMSDELEAIALQEDANDIAGIQQAWDAYAHEGDETPLWQRRNIVRDDQCNDRPAQESEETYERATTEPATDL
jgi:hypothetical protein